MLMTNWEALYWLNRGMRVRLRSWRPGRYIEVDPCASLNGHHLHDQDGNAVSVDWLVYPGCEWELCVAASSARAVELLPQISAYDNPDSMFREFRFRRSVVGRLAYWSVGDMSQIGVLRHLFLDAREFEPGRVRLVRDGLGSCAAVPRVER